MELGKDIEIPDGIKVGTISDGYHTYDELYDHRISLFIALLSTVDKLGWSCGWSKYHSDGELCFGGGWVIGWIILPNTKHIRYHMEDSRILPKHLEREFGSEWNGKEETLTALNDLVNLI